MCHNCMAYVDTYHVLDTTCAQLLPVPQKMSPGCNVAWDYVGSLSLHFHTVGKKHDLTKAQSDLGLPQYYLVTYCVTCWKFQLKMIDRVVQQEACIRQVLTTDRKNAHLIPTWQDLDVLESMKPAFKQLDNFTDTYVCCLVKKCYGVCNQACITYFENRSTKGL